MNVPEVCEQLTLYPEDSHASRFPWPESSAGRKTSGFCGLKCAALSGSLGRIASSVRTYLESSRLPPGRWSRIWSVQAITSSCCNLRLRLSARGTGGAAFSSSASPKGGLLPTPRANEVKDSLQHVPPSRMKSPGKCNLTQAIAMERMFTTPCAADSTGSTGGANHRSLRTDVSGQLNPEWGRVADGLPCRVERIRALGNAVVPQQAYPIFRALAEELNRRNDDGY